MIDDLTARLDALPRLGWVQAPSPVEADPDMAGALGLAWLGFKRDDLLPALCGGSKIRKLDHLLALPPWRDAPRLASVGAIGSGHLVSLCAACERLGKAFEAHLFWEPTDEGVLESLAYTASRAATLSFTRTRVGLALRRPGLLLRRERAGAVVVEPGATLAPAMVGPLRAALELAAQVGAGALPLPDRIYLPIGSGGTAVGLAVGLAAAGLPTVVYAVSATEAIFTPLARVRSLWRQLRRWLAARGVPVPAWAPGRVVLDHRFVGPGYGVASEASTAARARRPDLPLEPIYSGKALASLLADPPATARVLFWLTPRRAGSLPTDPAWRARLPPSLARRLDGRLGPTRRQWMWSAAAISAAGLVGARLTGTPPLPGFEGEVLGPRHAAILAAAAEALMPPSPALDGLPARVDTYARALSPALRGDLRALLVAVEHGGVERLTAIAAPARAARLAALRESGGVSLLLYRGVRDLCALGYYQHPATWPALGYAGPWVDGTPRPEGYAHLIAPEGAPPPGWRA